MRNRQVTTTFDKQYISGDLELYAIIKVPEHGVKIHHEPENDFITYYEGDKPENKRGKRPATRTPEKANPDDRYTERERTKEYA
jgi:hypothetical protein